MAVIAFSHERAWVKAAWAVERVLADLLIASPNEPRIREALEKAITVNSLSFDFIEEPTSSRLKEVLEEVIAATIQDSESLGLKWKDWIKIVKHNTNKRCKNSVIS